MNTIRKHRETAALLLILLLAAFLSIYNIWTFGYSNAFYAASVKSMLTSWKNFFFASLDPGGWITVDKPPVSLWIQTGFAKVLGFYGWSIILPQCLAAVASVAVIHRAVRVRFGAAAGLISALVLALSSIFIAVSKTNNTDSILIFFMILSAWAMLAACDRGKFRYLILSMVFLGIAYNAKTLEAFLILPALYAAYFFAANLRWRTRLWQLAAATLVLLVVSLSWSVIVDMTPADERPYVDNSETNSELELAFGYNGIQRIIGPSRNRTGTGASDATQLNARADDGDLNEVQRQALRMDAQNRGNNAKADGIGNSPTRTTKAGKSGGISNGDAGILRMFNTEIGGQDSWLLPFGLFSVLAMILAMQKVEAEHRRKLLSAILLWGGSVVTMVGYFSVSRFFHPYYISVMAPFLAALVGIGTVELWKLYRRENGLSGYLLPVAIGVTAAVQAVMLRAYPSYSKILIPLICVVSGIPTILLLLFRAQSRNIEDKIARICTAIGVAGLLLAPAVWTGYTVFDQDFNSSVPFAGPTVEETSASNRPNGNQRQQSHENQVGVKDSKDDGNSKNNDDFTSNTAFIRFLEETNTGEKFLIAVQSSKEAEPIILATGKPVMAVGGYSGNMQTLTAEKLEQMVKNGELKYYLVDADKSADEVTQWVKEHGEAVDPSLWSSSMRDGAQNTAQTLYDLSSYQDES
ncbi:MAG: PMT-2 domain-containing protein [Oscillospiraceae bacterium]|jgi:4-amino-4-deoxy-L-arabinose transferase-like glycosyltransferase